MSNEIIEGRLEHFRASFQKLFRTSDTKSFSFESAIAAEHRSKPELIKEVREIVKGGSEPFLLGQEFYKTVNKRLGSIGSRQSESVSKLKHHKKYFNEFYTIIGEALLAEGDIVDIFSDTHHKIMSFHNQDPKFTKLRSTLFHLLTVVLACRTNSTSIFGMVNFFKDVTEYFFGKRLFGFCDHEIKESYIKLNNLVETLYSTMKNTWNWNVKNRLEVQSALWMAFHTESKLIAAVRLENQNQKKISSSMKNFEEQIATIITKTEIDTFTKRRIGQDLLRQDMLTYCKGNCMLTGISNKELLRVSHIKPWKNSNHIERLDVQNCLLLSALWDVAFDRGLVTFEDDGHPKFSSKLKNDSRKELRYKTPILLTTNHKTYLQWHRKHVFKG